MDIEDSVTAHLRRSRRHYIRISQNVNYKTAKKGFENPKATRGTTSESRFKKDRKKSNCIQLDLHTYSSQFSQGFIIDWNMKTMNENMKNLMLRFL